MAISPDELRKKTFAVVPKGYDRPEVNRYLGAIADELQKFNSGSGATTPDNTSAQTGDDANSEQAEPSNAADEGRPAEATPRTDRAPSDDFDRVGNEISLMLRQAQESAIKIRDDAEIEARTLVDQVRLDIEADRVAHEQAAAELISRTEERASEIRSAAETYAQQTRADADQFAESRRSGVEAELTDSISEAEATRQLTAEHLASANSEAEARIAEAKTRASEIVAHAEQDAQARSDQMLGQARGSLQNLIEAETRTRHDLEQARQGIKDVLNQLSIAELDNNVTAGYAAEQSSGQES